MKIESIGEFGLIEKIRETSGVEGEEVVLGIGDDAAAIRIGENSLTLATTDMLLEGVHFNLSYMSPFQLGKKAVAVNMSDIAAMGGMPRWFLMTLGLPSKTELAFVEQFYAGASSISERFGVKLIGGDTVGSPDRLVINVILLGDVPGEEIICRRGARAGDKIFVTGTIGDSAAGLELLKRGIKTESCGDEGRTLINRHISPSPRIEEARYIAERKLATSMIDISDGLIQDLKHICDESGVRGEVMLDKIPLSSDYDRLSKELGCDIEHPLTGGEDYELLFTVPGEKVEEVENMHDELGLPVTLIGDIVEGDGVTVYDSKGKIVALKSSGYEHLKASTENIAY